MQLRTIRAVVRNGMSYNTATIVSDALARLAPHVVQRAGERLFDFPIASTIRSRNILLIRVPKTASVSLSMRIYGFVTPHRRASFYQDSDPAFFEAATKVALVRHPVHRLVSAFTYGKKGGNAESRVDPKMQGVLARFNTLEDFVSGYLVPNRKRLHLLDPTLHPQHTYVCDRSGAVIVDHLLRYEEFGAVERLLDELGIPGGVPHLNASRHGAAPRGPDLSPVLFDRISRVYRRDMQLFGYDG